jgi:hypothetical protein
MDHRAADAVSPRNGHPGADIDAPSWRHLFDCAICQRRVTDFHNRGGRDRQMEPICRYCEGQWSERPPSAGAFMDRRMACRLAAMANALLNTAHIIDWGRRYGRS